MLKFLLLVNKQGQTRLSQYYEYLSVDERSALEADVIRKCLARNEQQVCVGAAFARSQSRLRLLLRSPLALLVVARATVAASGGGDDG